jgi:hypothetical protein
VRRDSATVGRLLLSFVAVFWSVGALAADFNATHVFNPAWSPHARFHAAFQAVLSLGTAAVALAQLWTYAPATLRAGAALTVSYPLTFFVVAGVPGVAFSDPDLPGYRLAGVPGQLVMALVTLVVAAVGFLLARSGERRPSNAARG